LPPSFAATRITCRTTNDFDALADAVDGADGGPSPDAQTGYRLHAQMLVGTLHDFTALKAEIAKALAAR
jgi:hypothetical protein